MADGDKVYTQEEVDALVAEQVSGLKANRDELLKEAKRAKDALKNYDGVDPEKYKQLVAAAEEAERKRAAAEGDWTKLREQMQAKHGEELSAREKRIQKLENALNRRLTSDELRKALSGKVIPEYEELLVEHGSKFIKMNETEDDFGYAIHDGKGNPQVADGSGTPMDLNAFVEQNLKQKFPGAFLGTGSSGGGAAKPNAGGGGSKTVSADGASFLENVAAIAKGEKTVKVAE